MCSKVGLNFFTLNLTLTKLATKPSNQQIFRKKKKIYLKNDTKKLSVESNISLGQKNAFAHQS